MANLFSPFYEAPRKKKPPPTKAEIIDVVTSGYRPKSVAIQFASIFGYSSGRSNFETAPYDFKRIDEAIDTDSYAKQAFAKYRELFWKEGWEIVGENPEAVDYLYQRIDYMEMAMQRPFQEFLCDVLDCLVRYHNVFITKERADIRKYFPGRVRSIIADKDPINGYALIPTHTVEIARTKFNQPRSYRQRQDDLAFTYDTRQRMPRWESDRVIHLARDRKVGHIWGTPFLTATLDDLVALRQIEEDIQNLIHRELFPLYKYRIGTDLLPATPDELTRAVHELEQLRVEGGLAMPHRHDIEVIGQEKMTLEVSSYLGHFMQRVAIGLGMYPHHLGMVDIGGAANRSATDRLDVALYDKIKEYQKYFADQIRYSIFNELLREGGFDPTVNPKLSGVSDQCFMQFHQIDIDTEIKRESHEVVKAQAGIQQISESRLKIGQSPEMDDEDTLESRTMRQALKYAPPVAPAASSSSSNSTSSSKKTTSGSKKAASAKTTRTASKGSDKRTPNKKAASVVRPTNQFGTRTSPNIRRSVDDDEFMWLNELAEELDYDSGDLFDDI